MGNRQQSGTELISTFGIALVIIAVAIAVLLIFASAPSKILPTTCSIYGTVKCTDVAYGTNTIGVTTLVVFASSQIHGTLNVTSFNAVVGGVSSTSGYCSSNLKSGGPSLIPQGQATYCVATFPNNVILSQTYTGTFTIIGNYCSSGATTCSSGTSPYSFSGSFNAHATAISLTTTSIITSTTTTTTTTTSTTTTTTTSTSSTTTTILAPVCNLGSGLTYTNPTIINGTAGLTPWSQSTNYPSSVSGESCVTSNYSTPSIYCMGGTSSSGYLNKVYYAPVSGNSVGAWTATSNYPIAVSGLSCVATFPGDIYCVGGKTASGITNAVYYAPITSSGVGAWKTTRPYPVPIYNESCAEYNSSYWGASYAMCTGGITSNGLYPSNWLGILTTNGIFASNYTAPTYTGSPFPLYYWPSWTNPQPAGPVSLYPVATSNLACVAEGSYMVCIGGRQSSGPSNLTLDSIIYGAELDPYIPVVSYTLAGFIGGGYQYPLAISSHSCVEYSDYIYCTGGISKQGYYVNDTFGAYASQASYTESGQPTNPWTCEYPYPSNVASQSCAVSNGNIYCVGGSTTSNSPYTSNVYTAQIQTTTTTSIPTTTSTSTTIPQGYYAYLPDGSNIDVYNPANGAIAGFVSIPGSTLEPTLAYSSNGNTVYAADSNSNIYTISNAINLVIATIPVTTSLLRGIAVSAASGLLYAVGGGSFSGSYPVSTVNVATNTLLGTIPNNNGAYGDVVTPNGQYIYIPGWNGAESVYVASTSTNTITATIAINFSQFYVPMGVVASPSGNYVYVTNSTAGKIAQISTSTNKIVREISTGVGSCPTGLAISPDGSTLYALGAAGPTFTGPSSLFVVNTLTNGLSNTISNFGSATGCGGQYYLGMTPNGKYVYAKSGSGISIINQSSTAYLTSTTSTTTSSTTTILPNFGAWNNDGSYPISLNSESCAATGGYIYCVGGSISSGPTNKAYYATVSGSTIGSWSSTTSYPISAYGASCTIFGADIYCVGGTTSGGATAAAYYAPLSSSGIGSWSATSSYPVPISGESCTPVNSSYSLYIACVGGKGSGGATAGVYYSSPSGSGLSSWGTSTNYPTNIYNEYCYNDAVAGDGGYADFLVCFGGNTGSAQTNAEYETTTPFGSSSWYATGTAPIAASSSSCISRSGYIYCIGGATPSYTSGSYYASSYPGSAWSSITSYPTTIGSSGCAVYNNFVYCVGGSTSSSTYTSAVYSSQVYP